MDPFPATGTLEEQQAWADTASARITELETAASAAPAANPEAEAKIAELQTALDDANGKLAEIENAKTMAEVDALLAEYDLPEDTMAVYQELGKTNPDQAKALLAAVPKKKAPEVVPPAEIKPPAEAKVPPTPMHNPGQGSAPTATPQEIANKITARTTELQRANPRMSYAAAFAQAEKEIRAKN